MENNLTLSSAKKLALDDALDCISNGNLIHVKEDCIADKENFNTLANLYGQWVPGLEEKDAVDLIYEHLESELPNYGN